jgi:hypothetical protein
VQVTEYSEVLALNLCSKLACQLLQTMDSVDTKSLDIRGCIQNFPDWPSGARTANGYSSLPLDAVLVLLCESV